MSLFNKEFRNTFGYHKAQRDVCGECKHHKKCTWQYPQDWYCDNKRSDYYSNFTAYGDTCGEFEQRGVEW